MGKAAWGLPEGSVRALLVLLVTATACVLFYLGRPVPDLLAKLTEDAFLFYFLTRGIQWQAQRAVDPAPPEAPAAPDPKEPLAAPADGAPPA
jgi:hypothetical protein